MKNNKFMVLLSMPVLASLIGCNGSLESPSLVKDNANNVDETAGDVQTIKCSFPVAGENVDILKPAVTSYIAAMKEQAKNITVSDYTLHDFYAFADDSVQEASNDTDKVRISDYYSKSSNFGKSKQVCLVFDASNFNASTEYEIKIGLKADLSDAKTIKTTDTYATVENLLSNKTYYWQVSSGEIKSEIATFKTNEGFRYVTANGITNVRDMGGRPVSGGKHIKQGLIFRGGEVVYQTVGQHTANLNSENAAIFKDEMGIAYEVDLRGDDECGNLTESPLKTYYREEKSQEVDVSYMRIANMGAYDYFFKMSSSDARWEGVKNMFLAFKNANEKHVYFHCWGGADRTGTAGFLLGGLLGMSYTDLIIDFELTSFANNYRPHTTNDPKYVYRFPAFINEIRTATDSNGNLYWAENKTISKIVEDILIDKAGLTSQDIIDIKNNLLED